jgi:glycosyltransferase involved in cell wall biosynthesis
VLTSTDVPNLAGRRLLFAIGGLGRGGSETQFTRLLENLPPGLGKLGVLLHDPTQVDYLPRVQALGAELFQTPYLPRKRRPVRVGANLLYTTWTVRRFRPAIIYAWLDETALYLAPVGRLLGIPVVVARRNISGSASEQASPWIARAQHGAERLSTLVTANSQAVAEATEARGVARDRIRVVSNGHRTEEPLPFPGGSEMVIGYLANFRPEKGHLTLVDVASHLRDVPGWRLVLAGRGELREEIESLVVARGLADRVEFQTGDDARAFWAQCHLAMLLSEHEGSPNALIEAAFAGRPILASAVGGTPEVVGKGAGFLVRAGDAEAAASIVRCLLADRAQLSAMGLRGSEHVRQRFSLERMVEGHLQVLDEALAEREDR